MSFIMLAIKVATPQSITSLIFNDISTSGKKQDASNLSIPQILTLI